MADPARERARLVAATANRLRLVQIDFADEDADVRRQYLSDEIQRAIGSLVPDERDPFLRELTFAFPTWDAHLPSEPIRADQGAAAAVPQTDQREQQDPSYHLERLIELAQGLSPKERASIAERLRRAQLTPKSAGDWPVDTAATVQAHLQVPESRSLDPVRTLELLPILINCVSKLDQIAWKTWKQIAPKSDVRRQGDLKLTMARFAAGDQEFSRTQVDQGVGALQQLVLALVNASGHAGKQVSQEFERRYSPQAMEGFVPPSKWGGRKDKLWDKYVEMAPSAPQMEREIIDTIAKFTESLIKGLGR